MIAPAYIVLPARNELAAEARSAVPCLLDRFQAITNVACEACQRHDVPQLEQLVLARDGVLADLGRAMQLIRDCADQPGTLDETTMELLAGQAHAFELLEARLVACVRSLRDQVQAALAAASRERTGVRAYQVAANPALAGASQLV
jgi:hypothetical protein